ncbi:MAG: HAMP domain-containing protein [Planctomycetes bacterium]|nr:HAMP domain-containing protein [Planctomycetota bacterium]
MSYRTRLLLGVCSLVVLTGMTVTWLAYRSARASTEGLAQSLFREVSGRTVENTQAFVMRAAPVVESLRELTDDGLQLDDSDKLAPQLLAFLKANRGVSWVSYGDRHGTFTGAFRPSADKLLINQSRIVGGITDMVEHDASKEGLPVLVRKEHDTKYDPRRRPYYEAARRTGKVTWTAPYIFYEQGIPGISCAAPVYDKTGALLGVLSVDFDLIALSDFVSKLSVGENGRVFLFTYHEESKADVLLADPTGRLKQTTGHRGKGKFLTLADAHDELLDALRSKTSAADLRKQPGDPFHFFTFGVDGKDYFGSTTMFKVGDDQMWVVGAVAPQDDFLSGVWRSQRLALLVAIAAVIVAGLLAVFMARRVSGPVLSLVEFMRRIGAGDLDAQADFRGGSEFQQLSHALNQMIFDLRDRMRLRHSLDIAMEVQQRLLPQQPPAVRQLDIAGPAPGQCSAIAPAPAAVWPN